MAREYTALRPRHVDATYGTRKLEQVSRPRETQVELPKQEPSLFAVAVHFVFDMCVFFLSVRPLVDSHSRVVGKATVVGKLQHEFVGKLLHEFVNKLLNRLVRDTVDVIK